MVEIVAEFTDSECLNVIRAIRGDELAIIVRDHGVNDPLSPC